MRALGPAGFRSHGFWAPQHKLSGCGTRARGIFPEQGSNLHLLHWHADSLTLCRQGSLRRCVSVKRSALWLASLAHLAWRCGSFGSRDCIWGPETRLPWLGDWGKAPPPPSARASSLSGWGIASAYFSGWPQDELRWEVAWR